MEQMGQVITFSTRESHPFIDHVEPNISLYLMILSAAKNYCHATRVIPSISWNITSTTYTMIKCSLRPFELHPATNFGWIFNDPCHLHGESTRLQTYHKGSDHKDKLCHNTPEGKGRSDVKSFNSCYGK